MVKRIVGLALLLVAWFTASSALAQQNPHPPSSGRTSPARVGAVMALLATFEDAGILPPEDSPDATRLIKATIQFQAAFMKSEHPAIRQWLGSALAAKFGEAAPAALETFQSKGWTSRSLEAVVDYAAATPVWDNPDVRSGMFAFNVGRADFDLLARIFAEARAQFSARGRNIHEVYDARRKAMPGAHTTPRDERPGSL